MNRLISGALAALIFQAGAVQAEYTVNVRGTEYPLTALMDSCIGASGGTEAQLRCFVALSGLVKEQSATEEVVDLSVTEALDALRAAAEYQDGGSGLSITGSDCRVTVQYHDNYYYVSRRNVTSIDLLTATFNAAEINPDQMVRSQGGSVELAKGVMQLGATATVSGGFGLESAEYGFMSKPASSSIADFADSVVEQIAAREDQSFDFVLVHPRKMQNSGDIWNAFGTFVAACRKLS